MEMKFLGIFVLATLLKHAGAGCYAGTEYPMCTGCGGDCTSGNGCLCGDGMDTCLPNLCIMNSNDCCPVGLYWNSSASCCTDEIICSPPCAGDEKCSIVGNNPICVCQNSLYINATINDLVPSLSCDGSTMTTSFSRCLVTYLGYDYNNLELNNKSSECIFDYTDIIDNKRVQHVQVNAQTGWCGNIATNSSQMIHYTNTLHIGPLNSILITKNPIAYNFTCSYNVTMQTSLNFSLKPVYSVATLEPISGGGAYAVKMAAYHDYKFTSPIQDDEEISIGSDIFLGIFIPDADGVRFTVRAVQCFATATNNRDDKNKVQLVSGGCPFKGEVLTEVITNGEGLEARIKIKAFAFKDLQEVYIFCDVRICDISEGCTGCKDNRNLRMSADYASLSLRLPLQEDYSFSSSSSQIALSWAMIAGCLLSFLSLKFF
ncbi:uromodulin-like [Spea bombifrons]|uniref:uromodulin-like n=1 Tax=Spea bombifrons TaxID=233779 RepID=UPI00234912B8|nr:uromodulin-like [Spea bombifrons]